MLEIAVCRLHRKRGVCVANADSRTIEGVNKGKRSTDYPNTISFRLTHEAWLGIQKEISCVVGEFGGTFGSDTIPALC